MKKIFALVAVTMAMSSAAIAAEVSNCWTQPNIVPGQFNILIETKMVSKETLLKLMDKASGRNIVPTRYPIVGSGNDGYVMINVEEVDYGVGNYRLTRQQLTAAVKKELQPFVDTTGVFIECNSIARAAGGR